MNEIDAKSRPVAGGHQGLFRRVHKAGYELVEENGQPAIFDCPWEAECRAWRALIPHIQTHIVGWREAAKAQAEVEFGRVFMGGGRTVEVDRR